MCALFVYVFVYFVCVCVSVLSIVCVFVSQSVCMYVCVCALSFEKHIISSSSYKEDSALFTCQLESMDDRYSSNNPIM